MESTCNFTLKKFDLSINNLPNIVPKNKNLKGNDVLKLKVNPSLFKDLSREIIEYFQENPGVGFVNQLKGYEFERLKFYLGRGVTYNPKFEPWTDPEIQVMGTNRPNVGKLFDSDKGKKFYGFLIEKNLTVTFFNLMKFGAKKTKEHLLSDPRFFHPTVEAVLKTFDWGAPENNILFSTKNSYSDSWGFSQLTNIGKLKSVKTLIEKISLSPVRSRVAVMKSSLMQGEDFNIGWHSDESYFLELRVFIPLQTSENYFLEIQDFGKFPLEAGYAYLWDTRIPHRPGAYNRDPLDRYALILGLNPWFTYSGEDTWLPNKYFLEHPYDIFAEIAKNAPLVFQSIEPLIQ